MRLRTIILTLAVGVVLHIGNLRAASQRTWIEGHVIVQRLHPHGRGGNENVVVWLTPQDGPVPARVSSGSYEMAQRNKQFQPHVLAVPVGSVVKFPNFDPFFHNVFSIYEGKRFDLGLYEAGSSRLVHFDRPGVSFIYCNIHSDMNAYILALPTNYYAVSDAEGRIRIPDIPPGRYRLEVWFERAKSGDLAKMVREVSISDNFSLGTIVVPESERLVPQHLDKYGQPYSDHGSYPH